MNIASFVALHARYQPQKTAIINRDETISYVAFDGLVRRIATRLRSNGIGPGDLVAVLMHDTPTHVAAVFAIARIGAAMLPLDWRAAAQEIARTTDRTNPKLIIGDDANRFPAASTFVGMDGIDREQPDPGDVAELKDQPFAHLLTSGTTGEPKVIVLTHEQMYGRFLTNWTEYPVLRSDRVLPALPLAYAAGLNKFALTICIGATLIMFPALATPIEIVGAVNELRADLLIVSPNVIRGLLSLPQAPEGGVLLPNLRLLVSATDGLQPSERAQLRARVARNVVGDYGTTGSGPIAMLNADDDIEGLNATGRPVLGMNIEIVDTDHRPVPNGMVGLVRLRGLGATSQIISGQAASDEGLRDGWYYPGDLGCLDAGGLLSLQGRNADLIKTRGLMVYSREVERVLIADPRVQEAAVVGVPCPKDGEQVAAFVILKQHATSNELIAHCRRNVASHKVPRQLIIVETLPRNSNGKVIKAQLQAMMQHEPS